MMAMAFDIGIKNLNNRNQTKQRRYGRETKPTPTVSGNV